MRALAAGRATKPSPPTWPAWPACTALPQANCGTRSAPRNPEPAGAPSTPAGWPRSPAARLSTWPGRCPSCAAPERTGRPGGTSCSRAARAATPGTTVARLPGCCRTTATCAPGTGTGSARRTPGSPLSPGSPASSRRNGATPRPGQQPAFGCLQQAVVRQDPSGRVVHAERPLKAARQHRRHRAQHPDSVRQLPDGHPARQHRNRRVELDNTRPSRPDQPGEGQHEQHARRNLQLDETPPCPVQPKVAKSRFSLRATLQIPDLLARPALGQWRFVPGLWAKALGGRWQVGPTAMTWPGTVSARRSSASLELAPRFAGRLNR